MNKDLSCIHNGVNARMNHNMRGALIVNDIQMKTFNGFKIYKLNTSNPSFTFNSMISGIDVCFTLIKHILYKLIRASVFKE